MRALGFFKGDRLIAGERHAHYFNRALQISNAAYPLRFVK
jgi:hypothetical protein